MVLNTMVSICDLQLWRRRLVVISYSGQSHFMVEGGLVQEARLFEMNFHVQWIRRLRVFLPYLER